MAIQRDRCTKRAWGGIWPKILPLLCGAHLTIGLAFAQSIQVTLVSSHFSVTDKSGRYISDLKRSDFTVMDNGVAQEISEFNRESEGPVSLVIMIDRSQSVSDRFEFIKEAASTCTKGLMHSPEDRGLLVAFDSKAYLLQDWTSDPGLLVENVQKLTAAGGSSLFDAVYKTCRDKFRVADDRRKVIVLFSDGEDTTSRATFRQALEMAKVSGVTIYAVGLRAEDSLNDRRQQGRRVLAELTELTGGRIDYPNHDEKVETFLARLEGELRNWYLITYYSNAPLDDAFHEVKIRAKSEALRVHGPKGYYADKHSELP